MFIRTKWKRQTSVGLELFVEAGNYAAYQRAYASRYGQLDGLPYPSNPLMMPGATHPMLPPSNVQSATIDGYYQALQNGMNGMPTPYGNMFGAHRPLPFHPMSNQNGFLPLTTSANGFYGLSNPVANTHSSPEHIRSNSISPTASSNASSHSPATVHTNRRQTPSVQLKSTRTASDDESDIEV